MTKGADFASGGALSRRVLVAVFAIAFILRLINAISMGSDPALALIGDGNYYWRGAQAWLDKGPFMHMTGPGNYQPQTERVPLYHMFLIPFRWTFGDAVFPALVGQAVVDAGTCVVIALLGALVSPAIGVVSGLLSAFWPNLTIHSGMILGDTLFVFLFSLLLLYSARFLRDCRTDDLAITGLLCGLAIMTRPIALFLPIAMAIAAPLIAIRHRRDWRARLGYPVLLLALAALPVLPLVARNFVEFDTLQLTSQRGPHMLNWIVGLSRAQLEGRPFEEVTKELDTEFNVSLKRDGIDPEALNSFERSRLASSFALEKLKQIPLHGLAKVWMQNGAINLAAPAILGDPRIRALQTASFYDTRADGLVAHVFNFLRGNGTVYLIWFTGGLTFAMIALALQVFGFGILVRLSPWGAIFAVLVIAYFLLINGPVSLPKYRLPFEPVLIVFQAIALTHLWKFAKKFRSGLRRA